MRQIFHSTIGTTVSRVGPGKLLTQTILMSSRYEAIARVFLDEKSFVISEAGWEIHRSPGGRSNGGKAVTAMAGQEAYLRIGSSLRAVGKEDGELPRELLTDCVKGIIQAETYLFGGRGFASAEDYENFMRGSYRDGCRRFSSTEGRAQSWFEFIADRKTGGDYLFNRYKTAMVYMLADGTVAASGSFIDSFHELSIIMTASDGIITACNADFIRVPHAVCREADAHLMALNGRAVGDITVKAAADCAGGPMGCNHLADLVYHTAKALQQC